MRSAACKSMSKDVEASESEDEAADPKDEAGCSDVTSVDTCRCSEAGSGYERSDMEPD